MSNLINHELTIPFTRQLYIIKLKLLVKRKLFVDIECFVLFTY